MKLNRVTMTGADDNVRPGDLLEISQAYPFVEWGILAGCDNFGNNRYPTRQWIERLQILAPLGTPLAIHIQGEWVKSLLRGTLTVPEWLLEKFQRVQLNFHRYAVAVDSESLGQVLSKLGRRQLIFQFDGDSGQHYLDEACASHCSDKLDCVPLFDLSGGAGVSPEKWPEPYYIHMERGDGHGEEYWAYHGYAGGLGPHNLVTELGRIAEACAGTEHTKEGPIWVDAETHLRSDSGRLFDLDKVRQFLEICKPYVSQ